MRSENIRLITGLVLIPAFLIGSNLLIIAMQTVLFIVLALLHGRKIRVVPTVIMLITIPLMNLLQENGRILLSIGALTVTAGALEIGVEKALTLIGLIYLSQFMVSGNPRFPGTFGRLLSLQFSCFDLITRTWKRPERGRFIASLDDVLYTMDQTMHARTHGVEQRVGEQPARSPLRELLSGTVLAAAVWGSFAIGFLETFPG